MSRAGKAAHVGMDLYEVEVSAVRPLTPHLVRITLAGKGLRAFRDDGPDQRFKLMLPRPGQRRPLVPDAARWYEHWLEMPADTRPVLRTYTIARARPDAGEVDVDVVLHRPAGPASEWAARARVGDRVAAYGARAEYEVPPDADWQLIAGDHTALPAIAAIVERFPDTAQAQVVVEVPGPDDRLDLPGVQWVFTCGGLPGAALTEAVRALPALPGVGYGWVAAERDIAATLRRHLVRDRRLTPDHVMFMGYWRAG